MARGVVRRTGKLLRQLQRKAALPVAYLRSGRRARDETERFAELERFCLFVGYPRSGHSLVGSLLDAHPDIAIAHELHVLRYLRYGFSRERILALILDNAERQAARGREQTGYHYTVPNMWQGRVRRLRVAGDKRGGTTIRKVAARPERLSALRREIDVPLRLVHVIRNPFDSIARMAVASPHRALEELCDHYFAMADGVATLWKSVDTEERVDVVHESLLEDPRGELARLCAFLGVAAEPDYLDACAGIVWQEPQRSRREIDWPPRLRAKIEARITDDPFFGRYSFDTEGRPS